MFNFSKNSSETNRLKWHNMLRNTKNYHMLIPAAKAYWIEKLNSVSMGSVVHWGFASSFIRCSS